ncbi:DUF2914 domain-containing protein [Fodinibius saliphilus]|uniref:DUF2914 domain-containing protein n=1 Tax=Fodinibius saliphilus TaxID=1920650 RepID=UPI0011086001|nr:DUF2914 domain-containing protein [Fodinibius saliphilus]
MVSTAKQFIRRHKKYAPVVFFIGGFIWDSLTLGRIDGWYSNTILTTYLVCLTACLYIFNLADDNHWQDTFIEPYQEYSPLAIQFFLGGLSSAYVIFFFQSVSFSKAMVFFLILVALLLSNELLKHRISNKYLQFGAYFFVNFTFFTFFTPVLFGVMNTFLFIVSGFISLISTLFLIIYIYRISPSTREEVSRWKVTLLIFCIYGTINGCYYFNLIPPVPLSLQNGMVAYKVEKENNTFLVSYEQTAFYDIFETYDRTFNYTSGDSVFVFTSIFAPTNLKKTVQHEWRFYDPKSKQWQTTDNIRYNLIGGRKAGFRGHTYKSNIWPGRWRVNVTTEGGMVLGRIDFRIIADSTFDKNKLTKRKFN